MVLHKIGEISGGEFLMLLCMGGPLLIVAIYLAIQVMIGVLIFLNLVLEKIDRRFVGSEDRDAR